MERASDMRLLRCCTIENSKKETVRDADWAYLDMDSSFAYVMISGIRALSLRQDMLPRMIPLIRET